MKYQTELAGKEMIAEGTTAFHFKRPEGFGFRAGQTIDLFLIDPPETDAEGNMRTFSLASAPHENELMIATRVRDSAFKRILSQAESGFEVSMDGPIGSFTLHQNAERPAILLVGGIGITPFRSMIRDAMHRGLAHKIHLFYANRRPEDAAFLVELTELAAAHPNLTVVPTMTEMEKSSQPHSGETGYITAQMLDRHAADRTNAIYYSAGPQGMVAAMREMLLGAGVSEDDMRTEEFSGY